MYYKEYVKSSYRHLSTCKNLLADIQDPHKTDADKKHWISEAYYLSGYVVECMLSYVLFYKYNGHVETNEFYRGEFLTHSLDSKIHHVCKVANRPLTGVHFVCVRPHDRKMNSMFSQWSVNFRYEHPNKIKIDNLCQFIQLIDELRNQILNQYPLL